MVVLTEINKSVDVLYVGWVLVLLLKYVYLTDAVIVKIKR